LKYTKKHEVLIGSIYVEISENSLKSIAWDYEREPCLPLCVQIRRSPPASAVHEKNGLTGRIFFWNQRLLANPVSILMHCSIATTKPSSLQILILMAYPIPGGLS
jgi:hypothetical protein